MDLIEIIRRWKRAFDNYVTYRRLVIILILTFCAIIYWSPSILYWLPQSPQQYKDVIDRCLDDRLTPIHIETLEFNANIRHFPMEDVDTSFLPFVGNGMIGSTLSFDSPLYIKTPKTLLFPLNWHPIINISTEERYKEAVVTHYVTGIATRYQCFSNGLYVIYQYYAHRVLPFLFIQDIKIVNPSSSTIKINISQPKVQLWPTASSQSFSIPKGHSGTFEYSTTVGMVEEPSNSKSEKINAVAISSRVMRKSMQIQPHGSFSLQALTAVHSEVINKWEFHEKKEILEKKNIEFTKKVLEMDPLALKQDHINVWQNLWRTGLSISVSKAAGAVNGDGINATLYYVLSNVRSLIHEANSSMIEKNMLLKQLEYAEGCYGYHHTLQASNLWSSLKSFNEVYNIVSFWLLTLEKQGCHKLITAGADGVMQAMVLSFGGFRFSLHHLEFNIHPKFLHRDYLFRRIKYANQGYVNVSVTLQENNKAILGVSSDNIDQKLYACDGGCIDNPVQLRSSPTYFPVKLTEPITAILYITSDKRHMELFKQTLHVKEIAEAPPHEHHVIALHRHGHHLGGLPTLFWASVCFLIVIFHLFLFKLIYNEYCGRQEKYRTRYGKL